MPSAKKSSINIEYLNFRNLDPFLPRIGDEAKWAPWKVGCRSGWRPPGRTKASPSPPPFRPYLDRRRSRFPYFFLNPGDARSHPTTSSSPSHWAAAMVIPLQSARGHCCYAAWRRWRMRTMEEDRPLLALSPSIPGCLESSDGSKLPSEGWANNEGWLGWLQCRSVS